MIEVISSQLIENKIRENNYKLLGQISVSEEDYCRLINYAREKVHNMVMATIPRADLMLALTLVQVAIRHYQDGKYWRCFQDEIGEDFSSVKLNYVGQIFSKTLRAYNLLELHREDNSSQMYVENIKAHAFVTNYYMQGFFDFAYAFFENNLFRELSEDLGEDLAALSLFMGTTLSSNRDDVSIDGGARKASKSYRLLKSTRAVFAQCELQSIYSVFYPILLMIDKYYYEGEAPAFPRNRFEIEFLEWCRNRQILENAKHENKSITRRMYSHKPYLKVLVDDERTFLVIPPQKFRNDSCDGRAEVIVTINGYSETKELELYKSFGIYISEEIRIPIPDVFVGIEIVVHSLVDKRFRIPANNYRVFNNSWESLGKFSKGHNYLLVKKGIEVTWEEERDLLDSTDVYSLWQYFSAIITENSICYIGNKPLSIIGEFSFEPVFDEVIEGFQVLNDDRLMKVTRTHPGISFVVEKNRLNGTTLIINENRYFIRDIREKNMYEWPEDKEKMAVNIVLENILAEDEGFFDIKIDVPGENIKKVCEYLLMRTFNCKLNKEKYIYANNGFVSIRKGGHTIYFTEDDWKVAYENEETAIFEFPICNESEYIEFALVVNAKLYSVRLPLNIFKYGFSKTELISDCPDYIWYADIGENLYLKIPGATRVKAYWGKEKSNAYYAEELEEHVFRIDISEITRKIKAEYKYKWQYINLLYEEGAFHQLPLPPILRNVVVEPYFKFECEDNILIVNINTKGNATLYLDIKDYHSGELLIAGRQLHEGKNLFPELDIRGFYDFIPYMEEGDEFGFDVEKTMLKPLRGVGYIDTDNLSNCRLQIQNIIYEEEPLLLEYIYIVETFSKEADDEYLGGIFRVQLANGITNWSTKKIFGKVRIKIYQKDEELKFSLVMYSKDEEDWLCPYYDKARHYILGCDNKLLDSMTDYDRFVSLDEDLTEYIVDTARLRRVR